MLLMAPDFLEIPWFHMVILGYNIPQENLGYVMYAIVSLRDLVYNSIIAFWVCYVYHSIIVDNYNKLSIRRFAENTV